MESAKAAGGEPMGHNHRPPSSSSDLMSSAKVIAGAAKSAMAHETNKIDKGRVAGATADLLGAAKHYGKLEEKSFGKYIGKAEGYLHTYQVSHSSSSAGAAHQDQQEGSSAPSPASGGASHHEDSHASSGGGSGYGDYIKLAQGFLKKH